MNAKLLCVSLAALTLLGGLGCNTTPTQDGAVAGGLLGAGLGAIVGNQVHGQTGEGALIGAGVGALSGALIGDQVDEHRQAYHEQPVASAAPPARPGENVVYGHYETRIVRTQSGETYEERVWVPDR